MTLALLIIRLQQEQHAATKVHANRQTQSLIILAERICAKHALPQPSFSAPHQMTL
jgi:hypothetical protein